MSYAFKFRTYFSIQLIKTARLFCDSSYGIESKYASGFENIDVELKSKLSEDNLSFTTGVIISCVSFLEANINEIFCDALDKEHNERLNPLPQESIRLMRGLWNYIEKENPLDKYQIALEAAGKEKLDKGSEPYQSVDLLIKLRNELVHYKTKTVSSSSFEPTEKSKIEKRLSGKFIENLFYKFTGNPYFPNKCLGYGCAKWAFNSVVSFTDTFYSKMGIKPYYDHVRDELINNKLEDINHDLLETKVNSNRKINSNPLNHNSEIISVAPIDIKVEFIHIDDLKDA